ncbi:hypothetical protein FIBSPDRAFT_1053153 [Athelia psychrophila]|uniref:Arginyl-tRNA--protein transferase 1 n=1 Tax=Athelia psychrophila TaxID=1759441 RepID=A0A167XF98_9AGAM|nr:hypothetical protein FIBSPDRAFT_1053153 [Fibularhizoctonia sp. CBS 109695]
MSSASSIITPLGPSESTCGYCGLPGVRSTAQSNLSSATLSASRLSCQAYQEMIDRGWRRSGTYCYKPDLKHQCCPNYTIKLDAAAFEASKSHRKLLSRWNRFILGDMAGKAPHGSGNSSGSSPFSLQQSIHAPERAFLPSPAQPSHTFEIILEPSTFTPEKFELFEKYQTDIHHDESNSQTGFKRFLVDSPLQSAPIPYLRSDPPRHLPRNYGSYHQLYRLDGQLIAVGVLDILPNCVSSVYFMYDKTWEKHSLGKLSALREVCLAKEMQEAGAPDMSALYMGFYIHSCPKMRYKGEYSPSYLADPEDYTWHPLDVCSKLLDKHRYACFSHPEHSIEGPPVLIHEPAPHPTVDRLMGVLVIESIKRGTMNVAPVVVSKKWLRSEFREEVYSCVAGLGLKLANEMILYTG